MPSGDASVPSPYIELDRPAWARLRAQTPLTLSEDDVVRLQGLGDRIDLAEVEEVYLALARLITLYVGGAGRLHQVTSEFLGEQPGRTPFVVGIAGSVAVGKSTTARLLRELLASGSSTPRVQLVTTDGFLFSNAELERRNLLRRKGFPESYDRRSLLRFVAEVKAGREDVLAPVYSHLTYDVVPGEHVVVQRPDVLIVEGLNVLQPARLPRDGMAIPFVSDFFDFSVYLDADENDLQRWYVSRFLRLRHTAFRDPKSYFRKYAELAEAEAIAVADRLWARINLANLRDNILPTRQRASLILRKGASHRIDQVALRRL